MVCKYVSTVSDRVHLAQDCTVDSVHQPNDPCYLGGLNKFPVPQAIRTILILIRFIICIQFT